MTFPCHVGFLTAWQPQCSWTSYMWLRTPRVSVPVNKDEAVWPFVTEPWLDSVLKCSCVFPG